MLPPSPEGLKASKPAKLAMRTSSGRASSTGIAIPAAITPRAEPQRSPSASPPRSPRSLQAEISAQAIAATASQARPGKL